MIRRLSMTRSLIVLLSVLSIGCALLPGPSPPTQPPAKPIPGESEQCHLNGKSFDCYDNPPDGESFPQWEPNWGYVCLAQGGGTTRVAVPDQCPVIEPPPPDLPQPQCGTFTDRGGTLRLLNGECDCWTENEWNACVGTCADEVNLVASTCFEQKFRLQTKTATNTLGDRCGTFWKLNIEALAEELRVQMPERCVIAGIEAIFIQRDDGKYEERHAVFSANGCWTNSGFGKYIGCHLVVGGTPPPTQPPPTQPPPSGVCLDPNPRGLPARFDCQRVGNLNKITCTYKITEGRSYCDQVCSPIEPDVCYTGRNACPVRIEGDPERVPCEREPDVIGVQQ
jgi:hypothetical protein